MIYSGKIVNRRFSEIEIAAPSMWTVWVGIN